MVTPITLFSAALALLLGTVGVTAIYTAFYRDTTNATLWLYLGAWTLAFTPFYVVAAFTTIG